MKDGVKLFIILLIMMLLVGGAFFALKQSSVIPDNPIDTVGNTPSNLYNGGLFCQDSEGKVFFSNVYDGGALYSMDLDESNIKKLNKYSSKWINAAGDYLYYYESSDGSAAIAGFGGRMMGLYRQKKTSTKLKCLDKTPCGAVVVVGNYIYYQHYTNAGKEGMTLYKMKTDKSEYGQVIKDFVDPSCAYEGNIYYAGTSGDHTLYRLNTPSDSVVDISQETVYNPVINSSGTGVYYMNVMDDYKIYFLDLSNGDNSQITDERVDCFNVAGAYIYYQTNDSEEPALMRCTLDGQDSELVASGVYTNINSTSEYVYFRRFDTEDMMFKVPVNGAPVASEFTAAKDAAKKEAKDGI